MIFSNNTAQLPELAFTHGGRFHADDVFSAALLKLLRPDIRVYRGYSVPLGFSGIVFDIGDGPFDHHKKGSPKRENGVPYAAFGLLWREYGKYFLSEAEAARFDEKFVQPLDLDDNTGCGNTLAGLIGSFNPSWDSEEDPNHAFEEAVEVAIKLLGKKLSSTAAIERGKELVLKEAANMQDGLVILSRYVPWKPFLVPTEAEFVIFPSIRGGYSLQTIPKDFTGKSGEKIPLPEAWRGQPVEALREITGVNDASFCHASGFMATALSEQGAVSLAKKAKQIYKEQNKNEQ